MFFVFLGPAMTLQQPCNDPATTLQQPRCRVVAGSVLDRCRVFAGFEKPHKNK